MASVTSLGVHTPVALPYLINEGILPPDPKPDQYQWETYVWSDGLGDDDSVEEEILATKDTVVWSQGKFIRNVHRFDQEGENVSHALLTSFTSPSTTSRAKTFSNDFMINDKPDLFPSALHDSSSDQDVLESKRPPHLAKALVVILKTKAHIFFLKGPIHVVDLPFEVSAVFPAPQGLILQRRRAASWQPPPTPQPPRVPTNSFFSTQSQPTSSYLQSSSLSKSFAKTQYASSNLQSGNRLEALFQDIVSNAERSKDDDVATLYSLTDPLADFGVVTYTLQRHRPRLSGKIRSGLNVDFVGLEPAEEIIYISPQHELTSSLATGPERLIVLVTMNYDIHTITIWHAWYLEEKSLRTLLKLRAERKAAKARRRSSFLNTHANTGTTTPAPRQRDGARESFAAPGTLRHPGEPSLPQPTATGSRKPTQEEEAAVMALQMDPDYQPTGSQQPMRDNRRISSMNTDLRAGHGTTTANTTTAGARRHTSFGGPSERRSLGHRRSRGSTPGSVFSRSFGGEDDHMDLDSTIDYDGDETIENTVRHIRATYEACGIDNVFGSMEEGFKRELVVRRVHTYSVGPLTSSPELPIQAVRRFKVVSLSDSHLPRNTNSSKLNIYIHQRENRALRCLSLQVLHRPLWPELDKSPKIPIPTLISDDSLGECDDIIKLQDIRTEAVLLNGRGIILSLDNVALCPLPPPKPYHVSDPLEALTSSMTLDRDVGENRTLQPPAGPKSLALVGIRGTFDEVTIDGIHHRRSLQLRPRNIHVGRILDALEVVLSPALAQIARSSWCRAHAWFSEKPDSLQRTVCNAEFMALISTVFLFVIELLDPKARVALNLFKLASDRSKESAIAENVKPERQNEQSILPHLAWTRGTQGHSQVNHHEDEPKDQLVLIATASAIEMSESDKIHYQGHSQKQAIAAAVKLMLTLHILREEDKLCSLTWGSHQSIILAPVIAQLGNLLGLPGWSYAPNSYYDLEGASESRWAFIKPHSSPVQQVNFTQEPVGIFQWFEQVFVRRSLNTYPTMATVAELDTEEEISQEYSQYAKTKTPRLTLLHDLLDATDTLNADAQTIVEKMAQFNVTIGLLDTFPESIAAPFKEALARCETDPPATWSPNLLELVGRDDLVMSVNRKSRSSRHQVAIPSGARDIMSICHALDQPTPTLKTKEASRHAVSQLIFNKDRRLVEATSLMHFNSVQVAECPKLPEWTEAQHFDQQRRLMFFVTIRMIALPAGDGMLHYDSQTPLLTERYHLPGFSSTVLMQPMGHTLTADRTGLTEEKVNWAYFHAGVSAGLRVSRNVKGIDTSWIAFNKPNELTNRHAGLLLALGLSGHLRHLAKWLSFKYLTPKHTMTSIGLLLGLSASYLGTMDSLVTRMLSVHITRMLPPGAAELNVAAVTQTAGLMGIGLLYYDTQHRRMSEVMLSEIEHMEVEDPDSGPDLLRDESYRLAAGFALGLINLAKGNDLRGLHGMHLPERLLAVAVGPRPVHAVHVFDRATAGAVIAIALVYMKSGDRAVASKIDIPDTEAQFDQVRPDVLLLRAMAKHIIMWDNIQAREPGPDMQGWIHDNLPKCYKERWREVVKSQIAKRTIDSAHIPLFNVYTGLTWALALRYAGSGNEQARDEILRLLDFFHTVSEGADAYYYDGKLGRSALRRCIDVLALSAAMVMAGTGDIITFRYLRRMHGRTDSDTPYGSHLAAHMAIGALFLGGGTFTFGTTNLAVASLICAFYPLFPTDVHDNRVHLQAFRHFWVFAAEARCIVIEDIDTQRPVHMPIEVTLRDGRVQHMHAPCLLPTLETISTVSTADSAFWQVTLDFARNPAQLMAFRTDQRVYVRRCPAAEAHASTFSASLAALDAARSAPLGQDHQLWRALFTLPAFKDLDQADVELVLPPDVHSSAYLDERGTAIDDRIALAKAAEGGDRDGLWNLRVLFAWAERAKTQGDGKLRWLGHEVVESLKAKVEARMQNEVSDRHVSGITLSSSHDEP